jgi:hypothetical protein
MVNSASLEAQRWILDFFKTFWAVLADLVVLTIDSAFCSVYILCICI